MDLPARGDEGLLRRVCGVGLVAYDRESEAVHGTHPVMDDQLERFAVAPAGRSTMLGSSVAPMEVASLRSTHLMPARALRFILLP